jgi:DegV family protein with EDD domain
MAKNMVLEEIGDKFIHVFDSLSASIGETLVSLKIYELAKRNLDDSEIVDKVNQYIKEMKTFFILESLDNLIKAGRISKLKGQLASALSIKLIMGGSEKGTIKLVDKVRGSKRALRRLVDIIGEQGEKLEERVLGIAHCNCLERALELKEKIQQKYKFKDIIIVEMAGLSTVYANEGGIVIAF